MSTGFQICFSDSIQRGKQIKILSLSQRCLGFICIPHQLTKKVSQIPFLKGVQKLKIRGLKDIMQEIPA